MYHVTFYHCPSCTSRSRKTDVKPVLQENEIQSNLGSSEAAAIVHMSAIALAESEHRRCSMRNCYLTCNCSMGNQGTSMIRTAVLQCSDHFLFYFSNLQYSE